MEVFSEEWAGAWRRELNASQAYRRAGANWEGTLLLEMSGGGGPEPAGGADPAVYLDLRRGVCHAARAAGAEDRRDAEYWIRADVRSWRRILSGDLDPIFALMSGRLELPRGRLDKLVLQVRAARELVAAAATLDAVFPADRREGAEEERT